MTQGNRRTSFRVSILVISMIVLLACAAACHFPGLGGKADVDVVVRLHGSNTIGSELAPALVEAYLKKMNATDIKRVKGIADEMTIQASLPGESGVKAIEIKAHGSDTAIKALENGECDIAMMSRGLKGPEIERLAKFGDMKARGSENVIAMDGIAVIVNRSNPVKELSLAQIAQIFTGEVNDWSRVANSRSGEIQVYARDDKSGTFGMFRDLVLGTKKLVGKAKRIEDSKELSDAVANDPNGVGFVGLPYVGGTNVVAVSDSGTQPLKPTAKTINQREYLLQRELYFYLPQTSSNKLARELVLFALSPAGQEIARTVGFVSQTIDLPDPTEQKKEMPRSGIPAKLIEIRKTYQDFPTRFYFRNGSAELDTKSLDDFDRIGKFMEDHGVKEIAIIGFTDNRGSDEKNLTYSLERAKAVEKEFVKVGVKQSVVLGFGKEAPNFSNDKPEGRDRNRRVEIYYK